MALEALIAQVWSPDVRPLAEEAWRCYNAGALRASIAATWTAVTADIITKLVWLADDGDRAAEAFRAELQAAQGKGLDRDGVRAMQGIEGALLERAAGFELIDSISVRELERIRQDRNLCVHPSLRRLGEVYEPRQEVARGHLAVALATLLIHPPTQGRKVLEEFKAYICDPFFVPSAIPHIQATFFDRVRSATRRTLVGLAAKHALLELDTGTSLPAAELADRMAMAIRAFAERDRALVRTSVAEQIDRFQKLDGAVQVRALIRLGDQDYFWDGVDPALATRLQGLVNVMIPVQPWEPLPVDVAARLALVRSAAARVRLPFLEGRFETLSWLHRLAVATTCPDPYFVPAALRLVKEAGSWRNGEHVGRLLVQHAQFLTIEDVRETLASWSENTQCRTAADMPDLAVHLFYATAHLGQDRAPAFVQFLTDVRAEQQEEDDYYRYPALEATLRNSGYLQG